MAVLFDGSSISGNPTPPQVSPATTADQHSNFNTSGYVCNVKSVIANAVKQSFLLYPF